MNVQKLSIPLPINSVAVVTVANKKTEDKIRIKKLAAIICAAVLILSFAACNENTDKKESADPSAASEVAATAAKTTAAETTATETTAAKNTVEETTAEETTVEATAAAAKVEDTDIIGTWEFEPGGFTYTFNDDGTGKYEVVGGLMTFSYEADGSKLTLNYDDGLPSAELEYSIDGDTLNIRDSAGNDTIYHKK